MPVGNTRRAVGALAVLAGAGALVGCAVHPDGHLYAKIPGYRIDPIGAWKRGYQFRSLEEIRAHYERPNPECGGSKPTSRLLWKSDCELNSIACQIPYIAPQDQGGCETAETVEDGLREKGL
jgi:hypothetical protein